MFAEPELELPAAAAGAGAGGPGREVLRGRHAGAAADGGAAVRPVTVPPLLADPTSLQIQNINKNTSCLIVFKIRSFHTQGHHFFICFFSFKQ